MGVHVANFIRYLVDRAKLDTEKVILIGHSLGAHIVGISGKRMRNYTLPKIIGLDPASPLFSLENPDRRLAKGDARYIEIIHSNAGILGLATPLGNASFYPNGGKAQPGCGWDFINKCAHSRSYMYYAESIHSTVGFYGWQCKSYEDLLAGLCHVKDAMKFHPMGGELGEKEWVQVQSGIIISLKPIYFRLLTIFSASGIFYLQTNEETLFARGKPKLTSKPNT